MRSSIAAITCGTHWPFGSRAVRQAMFSVLVGPFSDSEAAITSPALLRHRDVPV